jgi:alkanesulfonate monooxygenase SsuD/methylene tetrahydromethanopterin reductase-like flavin-dependent oxidoreductase (luciferase family)
MVNIGLYTSAIAWPYEDLRTVWLEGERLGFDSAHMMDNSVGPIPWPPEKPVFETFTALPALAEATSKIRIGPLVTPSGRRHPALFAKMTSVLDVISGGRLILAMGPGDEGRHFRPWGMAFSDSGAERVARLREEIEVIRLMWGQETPTYEGQFYRLDHAPNNPKPIQEPHPPIWVGLGRLSRRLMPRLAAEVDGFNVYTADDLWAKELLSRVEARCKELRRDFGSMTRTRHVHVTLTDEDVNLEQWMERQAAVSPGVTLEDIRAQWSGGRRLVIGSTERCVQELAEIVGLGFNYLIIQFHGYDDPNGGRPASTLEYMDVFARKIMPELRSLAA